MSENRCPSCGAPLPVNAPGGHCQRCMLLQGLETEAPRLDQSSRGDSLDHPPRPGSVLETVGVVPYIPLRDTAIGEESTQGDPEATGPAANTASSPAGATSYRSTYPDDPTRTADGSGGSPNLTRGDTVRYFGDYEIQNELGRGGMGVVYKAKQVTLNRPVALKLLKFGMLADDVELRRFQNEAEAVALLDHPGIVPVYEVGEHEGQRYFSMKLIEGSNLAEQLASFQDDLRSAVILMIGLAGAVQHAHMRGILHRDLKPANILINAQGDPQITDFGLAKFMESDVELTVSGAIMGTPAYMSPEQAAGRRELMSLATDVYGLGAILYATLTGKAPFGGESVIETLDAVRTRPPEPPTKRNTRIPRDLELICLKCLEKNPTDRYPTAGALADDLRHWAAGEPVSVRAAGAVERVAKWARRKPILAVAYTLGLLAALLGGLGGLAVWQGRAAATAKARAERLNVELSDALDKQRQLADQLKQIVDEKTTLANSAGTARDNLVAMINDLVQEVNRDPIQALSAAVLEQKLNAISEKTKIEFKEIEKLFQMIGN